MKETRERTPSSDWPLPLLCLLSTLYSSPFCLCRASLALQAAAAGRDLRNLIGDESVYFIISPYTRTRMTYDIIRETLGRDRVFAVKEDPRLRGV